MNPLNNNRFSCYIIIIENTILEPKFQIKNDSIRYYFVQKTKFKQTITNKIKHLINNYFVIWCLEGWGYLHIGTGNVTSLK